MLRVTPVLVAVVVAVAIIAVGTVGTVSASHLQGPQAYINDNDCGSWSYEEDRIRIEINCGEFYPYAEWVVIQKDTWSGAATGVTKEHCERLYGFYEHGECYARWEQVEKGTLVITRFEVGGSEYPVKSLQAEFIQNHNINIGWKMPPSLQDNDAADDQQLVIKGYITFSKDTPIATSPSTPQPTPTEIPGSTPPPGDSTPPPGDGGDGGGGGWLVNALERAIIGGLGSILPQLLTDWVISLLEQFIQMLLPGVIDLILSTPDVHPNEVVEEINHDLRIIAIMLSSLVLISIGILYQLGRSIGSSVEEARIALEQLPIAIAFMLVSLPLLQETIEFTRALTNAFAPSSEAASLAAFFGLELGGAIILLVDAGMLLALGLLLGFRYLFLSFGASTASIIALAWAFPKTKKYAQKLISGWWTLLAIAPIEAVILRYVVVSMNQDGDAAAWLLGVAAVSLMFIIPVWLFFAGQLAFTWGYVFSGRALKTGWTRYRQWQHGSGGSTRHYGGRRIDDLDYLEREELRQLKNDRDVQNEEVIKRGDRKK